MKIRIPVLLLFLLCAMSTLAQTDHSVKGSVIDSAENRKLSNATVSVITAKDSMLVKFKRVAEDGSFTIGNLPQGKFILLISYPAYADYVEPFSLDSASKTHDFAKISMSAKARLLAEVVINGAAAITIKGDTTEFNASSYKIQPNSNVEDLLKQLPGIQVDKDGKITAQGQAVKKVLVDGEEFFGDDPTLVTKNIRGDMVDKVQVFDKKSDQAAFTGVDDGVKDKTINIKLKEGSKDGYFGKLDGGSSDKYYSGQAMFNLFKEKRKFSAYGTVANTGKTGLNWQDNSKYSGSGGVEVTDDGGIMIGGTSDDIEGFSGRYNGQGIPEARTGGMHYDSKWNSDKQSVNLNYKLGALSVQSANNTLTQNNLPTGLINSNSDQISDNSIFRQKADVTYQVKLDTTLNLKIAADGTLKHNETQNAYTAASLRGNNTQLNSQTRTLSNDGDQKLFNLSALLTKKFRKKGRTASLSVIQNFNDNQSTGISNSLNTFYNTVGVVDSIRNIDQYKVNDLKASILNTNLTYTEPLSKEFSLVLNYGMGLNNSSADRKSFNKSATGKYDVLDPVFSNDFELKQITNQGGAIFSYLKKKTTIKFGTKATSVDFRQTDLYTGKNYDRNFLNWAPQASYQYKFSQQKSFSFNYSGNTTQPTLDQIQPIRVNTDPLNVTLGNPDLKPSFRNNVSAGYNTYKILSGQYLYFYGNYSFTQNPIVNNTTTDAAGKNTYQATNLKGKNMSNFYAYADYNRKIKGDFSLGATLNTNGNTYFNLVNGIMNKTVSNSYSAGITASKYTEKKYDLYISVSPAYNTSESSLQKLVNNNGWSLNINSYIGFYLPGKLQVIGDVSYQYKEKTQSFNQDFDRLIWNTTLSKKFFKKENLKFSVTGNDLFNQNVGFSRSASNNMITQNSYNTVRRYVMFSLAWDFTKMGGAAAPAKK
jgi:outer membrane receptor protein involved in Fe transport